MENKKNTTIDQKRDNTIKLRTATSPKKVSPKPDIKEETEKTKTEAKKELNTAKKKKTDTERAHYHIDLYDVLEFLIAHSTPTRPVSINDMALYFTECIDITENTGKNDFHELDEDELDEVYDGWNANRNINKVNVNIRKQVERLIEKNCNRNLIFGIKICRTKKTEEVKETRGSRYSTECYYAKMPLDHVNVGMLRDAISVFPYAEYETTERIVDALNQMVPQYDRNPYSPEMFHADKFRGSYYDNIYQIRKALSPVGDHKPVSDDDSDADTKTNNKDNKKENKKTDNKESLKKTNDKTDNKDKDNNYPKKIKKISFIYCAYNANKELVETPHPLTNELVRKVNPIRIMWVNGYYYLVAFRYSEIENKLKYTNYRIDRMKDVKCLDDEDSDDISKYLPDDIVEATKIRRIINNTTNRIMGTQSTIPVTTPAIMEAANKVDENGFSYGQYKYNHPVMYAGDTEPEIVLQIHKKLMNNAIDTFGFDFDSKPLKGTDYVIITLHDTVPHGVKMWALEYGDNCEVLLPDSLRESIRKTAMHLSDIYSDDEEK